MIISVLALGKSVLDYKPDNNISIGVNDIYKYFKTDFIVCVDPPSRFTQERINIINNSTPLKFLSNRLEWNYLNNYKQIELAQVRGSINELQSNKFCYSNNSAYIACVLAYKIGAKQIIIYGADFVNHKSLSRDEQFKRAINDFKNLNFALNKLNVKMFVSSLYSRLSDILPVYR